LFFEIIKVNILVWLDPLEQLRICHNNDDGEYHLVIDVVVEIIDGEYQNNLLDHFNQFPIKAVLLVF